MFLACFSVFSRALDGDTWFHTDPFDTFETRICGSQKCQKGRYETRYLPRGHGFSALFRSFPLFSALFRTPYETPYVPFWTRARMRAGMRRDPGHGIPSIRGPGPPGRGRSLGRGPPGPGCAGRAPQGPAEHKGSGPTGRARVPFLALNEPWPNGPGRPPPLASSGPRWRAYRGPNGPPIREYWRGPRCAGPELGAVPASGNSYCWRLACATTPSLLQLLHRKKDSCCSKSLSCGVAAVAKRARRRAAGTHRHFTDPAGNARGG